MIYARDHKTTIKNIEPIVTKINKFVKFYAIQKNLVRYLSPIEIKFEVPQNIFQSHYYKATLVLLDYEREFIDAGFDYIYNNSPFKQDDIIPMKDIIIKYAASVHGEYMQIEGFVKKLLYEIPNKIGENDFVILNELYTSIKKEGVKNIKNIKDL